VPSALPESRDPQAHRRPDVLGAVVLAAAVGAIALALVEAPSWGWLSLRVAAVVVGALIVLGAVLAHSARHPAPVIDLRLLRGRSFSGAFAASVLYYAGFGTFVLNSVEFLTGQWHYSAIRAGLAIAPGPLCVLPFARLVAPRLAPILGGAGRVAVLGAAVNAGAQLLWFTQMTHSPSYTAHLLPAQLIGGAGVGLTIPSLLGAGTSAVPPAWFGTASGVLNMGRQVGTVLGVASLVGVLSTPAAMPFASYQHGVLLAVSFFAAASVIAAAVLARRPSSGAATAAPLRESPTSAASAVDVSPASRPTVSA
jgi:hypothetical protein